MYPDLRIINHKSHLFAHGGMQQWELNYWWACSVVVDCISARSMLPLIILKDICAKSIYFPGVQSG